MKKITFAIFALIIAATTLTSCDNEAIDSAIDLTNPENPENPGGGTASGDYWPTAVNNQWIFSQNGTVQAPMKMIGTDVFSGKTYFKFAPISGSGGQTSATASTWLNKSNGVYTLKTGDLNISAQGLTGMQSGFEYVILKDNIEVGATWTGSYNQTTSFTGIPPMTQTTTYTGTILEKDATVTVDGETFTDVIKMNITQETVITGISLSIVNTEYWFSKNVGPIRTKIYSGGGIYESILVDYTIN
jgi:hypothetical protein